MRIYITEQHNEHIEELLKKIYGEYQVVKELDKAQHCVFFGKWNKKTRDIETYIQAEELNIPCVLIKNVENC